MAQFFFPAGVPPVVSGVIGSILSVWAAVWWLALPLLTFFIFWDFWLLYVHYKFIVSIKWVVLEIKVPKNILKTPKAMEQIFAAAHTPYSYGLRWSEKNIQGLMEYWMSFEIVGSAGEAHFYLRLPKQYRNLMESAIYAQYPEAEIAEAEDYVKQMPRILPNEKFQIHGYEQILKKPDCYPIRRYEAFEESVEEHRVDSIAPLMEAISKLKDEEQIWIQILIRPTGDEWKQAGEEVVNKMLGVDEKKKREPWFAGMGVSFGEIMRAPFEHPSTEAKEVKRESTPNFRLLMLTPMQKEVSEGIQEKIAKLGFETTIRFIYIDKRESFVRDNVASITGYFRQFNTQNLNMFRPDKFTMSAAVHGFFKQTRLNWRRRMLYESYRDMRFNHHKPILNIEELATIYHFPILGVESTYLEKVESRKGGPPARLPTVE
ncbi:MAG TPA: hypothetical protein VNG29_03940 [Candidatus Paceibacterota bacterium]|nr:hypothetical protein [Candidatus Paceibacterota bacterium]